MVGNKTKGSKDRFKAAETRPQFQKRFTKNQDKVVLDERFSSALTDPRFQLDAKDKYGRRRKIHPKGKNDNKEELSAFYTVQEEAEGSTSNKEHDEQPPRSKEQSNSTSDNESEEQKEEGENEDPASRIAYLTAFSRGELDVSSSSSEEGDDEGAEDDDDDDDDDHRPIVAAINGEEDPVYGTAGVLDPTSNQQEPVDVSYDDSPFLVVTNVDWENLKAVDLFSILASFVPPGALKRLQVYKSDFGIERMEKDRIFGPANIWKQGEKTEHHRTEDEGDDESDAPSDDEEDDHSDDEEEEGDDLSFDEERARKELKIENDHVESDFDPEKLRAYEASKLKYFFAVAEFADSESANIAYREVDGMEFEHSSSAIDLRTIPSEEVDGVTTERPMRDEATSIPSNYEPPEFIVSALQQTNVQCTWDQGDTERERKLTKYGSVGWQNMVEEEDLQAYIASDGSSDEGSDEGNAKKGANMRKLLGLESDDEGGESESDGDEHTGDESSSDDGEEGMSRAVKFIPGQKGLEEKIRHKLDSKADDEQNELTPWQKYQEKIKQKRKERRQMARSRGAGSDHDIESASGHESSVDDEEDEDAFFLEDKKTKKGTREKKKKKEKEDLSSEKSKKELELLFSGENEEEHARDFDIRGIQRMEKIKGKKLRGARKRKEEKLASDVSGTDFKVDVNDSRFAAVLQGADDRFGIDKTDPHFRETPAMREILSTQTKRRKKKRQRAPTVAPDVIVDNSATLSAGSNALSSLVKRLKSKVQTSR